jgi:hypothetical protein
LTKDSAGHFVPLPQRELEIVLSAGFGFAVDLGSRMRGLAKLAKALNDGDYALAAILLTQAQFPPLLDGSAATRMKKAAAVFRNGASERKVLKHFLPEEELSKANPYHRGPGPGGGQFTTAEVDGASGGEAKRRGYVTKLSPEETLKRAAENKRTPGWLQPKDVNPANMQECVSLVRAVIPELPHSSQWKEGDPVTPESVKDLAPGTAIATFNEDGRYGNAPQGNHAAIFLGPEIDEEGRVRGIEVIDQSRRVKARSRSFPFDRSVGDHRYRASDFSIIGP